jgi:choline dehydrogenase-like flavoprotein
MVSVGYLCTQKISLDGAETLANLLRYFIFKTGPLTSNVAEGGLFLKTRDGLQTPDLQLLFGPAYYRGHGLVRRKEHCFGFGPTLITPESRGSISLRSPHPLDAPAIRPNYLSTEADVRTMIEGVRLARRLAHAKPFDPFRGAELHPGTPNQTMILSNFCGMNSRLCITRSERARWAMIRLRWSMRGCEYTGSSGCAWWMLRSCPTFRREIPMHR